MLEPMPFKRKFGSCKNYAQVNTAICQECSVGCGLFAYVADERIVDIQGNPDHPVNRGRLCAKGLAFIQGLTSSERITLPGTRNRLNVPFEAFDNWEKGIDLLAERLKRIRDQYGPESLVIACDPEAGLDFYLGARRFACLWGTPHVYHPLQEPADSFSPEEWRHPTRESRQWSESRTLVLIETDLAATHSVLFQQVLEAQKRGTKVIALDTRFTATLSKADLAFMIEPNRGNVLGLGLLQYLLEEQCIDIRTAQSRFKNFQGWMNLGKAFSPECLEAVLGLEANKIRLLARVLGRNQPAILITAKRLAFSDHYGIWLTLSRIMGWDKSQGGGWYPLESGMPCLDPTAGLEKFQSGAFQGSDLTFPYQSVLSKVDSFEGREIKALMATGNCLDDFMAPLRKQVSNLDLTVYIGSFPNPTRQAAHMVFPAAVWPEKDSLCFNNHGLVQWSPRIVKPGDACRTGLGFWMRLAQRFGWESHFPWKKANGLADQKAFYQWLFLNNPQTVDLSMDKILQGQEPISWQPDGSGAAGSDPDLPPPSRPPDIRFTPSDSTNYPLKFHATRGVTRSGEASRWWPWTRELEDERAILIHPRIAQALEIENGEMILAAGEDEVIEGPAAISRLVPWRLVWSLQRMGGDRVLVYRKGQGPDEARDRLRTIGLG